MSEDYYLRIARAVDLQDPKERLLYRVFEILPGFLSISTLVGIILLSWRAPAIAAFLAILFVLFWFFRTLYLMFYLGVGYKKMRVQEKIDWLTKLQGIPQWEEIYHLVILPSYKEPLEVLRQTLLALSHSDYPKKNLIVVLGMEESEGKEGKDQAERIEKEFSSGFFQFLVTFHPQNIEGEIPCKGSNETWAARKAREHIVFNLGIPEEKIIVSSFDADTVVSPAYFSCLTYHFLTSQDRLHTSFQPIPLFLNNIWQAPAISQVFSFSATFWNTMSQGRPEKLVTFSSHAMSLKALAEVGFKQTNVVSDDSRIFWQCFLHYNGNYRVEPLYYPVSMDANVGASLRETLWNMYKQQRRWAYGVAEIPYFLFGFCKNKKIPFSKKFSLGFELISGHWTWATAPIILFMFGWLPIMLGGEQFSQTLLSYNLPRFTSRILTLTMLGIITSVVIGLNLFPPTKLKDGKWKIVLFVIQWILYPYVIMLFTAFPALDAQIRLMLGKYMGFWPTPKFRKK